mgnify:CR=1 FL=1
MEIYPSIARRQAARTSVETQAGEKLVRGGGGGGGREGLARPVPSLQAPSVSGNGWHAPMYTKRPGLCTVLYPSLYQCRLRACARVGGGRRAARVYCGLILGLIVVCRVNISGKSCNAYSLD